MNKPKNLMVQVSRLDKEKKDFVDIVININECKKSDRRSARCPECQEKVRLMLTGDMHYEHETRGEKPCSFKTVL
jgi:hypothetical protein